MTADQTDTSGPGKPGDLTADQRIVMDMAIALTLPLCCLAILLAIVAFIVLFNPIKFGRSSPPPTGILVENRTSDSVELRWVWPGDSEPRRLYWHQGGHHWLGPDEFVIMPVNEIVGDRGVVAIRYQLNRGWRTFTHTISPEDRIEQCNFRLLIGSTSVAVQRSCLAASKLG